MSKDANRPFPIQLEVEFLDRLSEPVREKRARSASEIIRTALERYDFSNILVVRPSQLTISVRLPAEIRKALKKVAREKHTSIGQLVRTAVESYLPHLENETIMESLGMPIPHVEMPGADLPPEVAAPETNVAVETSTPPPRQPPPASTSRPSRKRKPKPKRVVRPTGKASAKPKKKSGKITAAGLKRSRPRRRA